VDKLLRDLARAYNLVTYFDGAVLHVAPASETASRNFSLPPAAAQQVLRSAGELQMLDARNTLRSTRDGTLVAVGARRYVQQVEELVRQAKPGAPSSPNSPNAAAYAQPLLDYRIFYLRYAWAQDTTTSFAGRQTVVPGVASILRSVAGVPQRRAGDTQGRPTNPKLRGQGLARQGGSMGQQGTLGWNESATRGTAVDTLATALGNEDLAAGEGQGGANETHNHTRIEADPRLNAVIVRDLPERLQRYAELVASLDVEPQSLEIEATIIDINTDRLTELGINWRWSRKNDSVLFGNGTASDQRLYPDQEITPSARGGVISTVLGDVSRFVSRISALQADGAAKVVSSPQVVTLSNVEAVFDNSSTFYVRLAGRDEVDLFNVTAGTSLRVTPHVFKVGENTRIKLLVQIEDGTITAQRVDTLPVVERSSLNTQALIDEGESLLIGGMVRDSTSDGVDKVPGLGDIPVLGNLFKSRSTGANRVERLFLITPRLASTRNATRAIERSRAPVSVDKPAPPVSSAPAAAPVSAYKPPRPDADTLLR
jgi:type III secretion protein C